MEQNGVLLHKGTLTVKREEGKETAYAPLL